MGQRGPKPGWKKGGAASASPDGAALGKASNKAAPAAAEPDHLPPQPPPPVAAGEQPCLSTADRNNPAKLAGDDLKKLAHNRGMSKSEMVGMSDDRIRTQLKYLTYRQYDAAEA